jgi:hypothetical protein
MGDSIKKKNIFVQTISYQNTSFSSIISLYKATMNSVHLKTLQDDPNLRTILKISLPSLRYIICNFLKFP